LGFGVDCGGALLRRFRLAVSFFVQTAADQNSTSLVSSCFVIWRSDAASVETTKTKAAEQSTAALHTKPQTTLPPGTEAAGTPPVMLLDVISRP
jgi:hypothetical protein